MSDRELSIVRLGRVEYADGLELQRLFAQARAADQVPDTLLLLEHSPVLTLGRAGKRENIVAPPEVLERLGVEIFETDRGGDVTYHGPGQLVGYPIFRLPEDRQDVRRYVRDVEEAVIRSLARFGLSAGRIGRWPGVWLGSEEDGSARKIGAIGVHLSRWLTTHGFALNVRTDLSHFGWIVPCGIREAGVTSMARELSTAPSLEDVQEVVADQFAEIFGARRMNAPSPGMRTVSIAVLDEEGTRVLLLKRTAARGGFWQILTGRAEPGESASAAATRELREETGFTAPVHELAYRHSFGLGTATPPLLVEEQAFTARVPSGAVPVLCDEHEQYEWVPLVEALERLPFKGLKVAVARAAALPPG